ncbi:MAG: hypothetical protein R6X13_06190 [bacterium]
MRGPYLLRPLHVDISVPNRVGGVYCLSRNSRQVSFIGRVERDLRDKIKSHWPEYQFFWYEPALSAREAYVNHCYAFHKHCECGEVDKGEHPKPPERADVKCPICGK